MSEPTVGTTFTYEMEAELNGQPWALSLAEVTLLLRKPDHKTPLTVPATVTEGVASATVIHDTPGVWRYVWRAEEGNVVAYSQAFTQRVSPGILEPRRTIPGVTQAVC